MSLWTLDRRHGAAGRRGGPCEWQGSSNLYREIARDLVPVVLELAGDEPPPPGS